MKRFLKNIITLSAAILFFSCSDDFINERLEISGVAASAIILSPDWDADDYQFQCEGAGHADYHIDSKPDWLSIDNLSGKFTNDEATVRCHAISEPDFSKTGIYIDQMLVTAAGKKYAIPVYYITEGNPAVQVNRTLEIHYNNYSNQLEISNSGDGILLWDLVGMPDWLTVDMNQFNPTSVVLGQGTAATIPFILNAEKAAQGSLNGTITLLTNDENNPQVAIAVSADLGTPQLSIYSYDLPVDLGTTATSKSLSIYNNGNGLLSWRFEDLPDWLSASPTSGISYGYSGTEITFTCNRSQLEPGLNSATILLKSNDPAQPSYPIDVLVRTAGDNANVHQLEGNMVDASFDKNTNTLYYVTSQPNKLIVYDVSARTILHETALSKAPTCLAISEDFTKALTGHGGMISLVNLTNQSVTKTIEVTGVLADIEFAANDWCAYTEGGDYNIQHTTIYWADLVNGNTTKGSNVYEDCLIRKAPNQDYIIGSETEMSAGVYVYDINSRTEKARTYDSFGDFWFAGSYMISSNGHVYRTSDLVSKDGSNSGGLSPIGSLQYPGENYYDIPWIDHCSSSQSIFGLKRQDYQRISSQIYQFEDNDYTLTNTYYYDNLYQPNDQTTAYEVEAHYLFANSSGTELSVLRKGIDNNNWSIEFVQVKP